MLSIGTNIITDIGATLVRTPVRFYPLSRALLERFNLTSCPADSILGRTLQFTVNTKLSGPFNNVPKVDVHMCQNYTVLVNIEKHAVNAAKLGIAKTHLAEQIFTFRNIKLINTVNGMLKIHNKEFASLAHHRGL